MAKRAEAKRGGGKRSGEARAKPRKRRGEQRPPRDPERKNRKAAADETNGVPETAATERVVSGGPGVVAGSRGAMRVIEAPTPGVRRTVGELRGTGPAFGYFWRRYLRKRYGRTFLGYLWLFLPVILPLLIGALVFGGILGVDVGETPYFLYFTIALGAWTAFALTGFWATRSLEISRSEIRRVYVPRLVPLITAMTIPLLTFAIYVVLALGATGFYVLTRDEFYLVFGPETLLLPVAVGMLFVFGLACGLWFSPLAPRARDVRRLASYVIGFWYFLTPVMYPLSEIPSSYQFLASLNPVTAPVEMVKQALLDIGEVTTLGLISYAGWLTFATAVGMYMFRKKERRDVGPCY